MPTGSGAQYAERKGISVMEHTQAIVSSELGLRLLTSEGALPLRARLRYSAEDPYAVETLFDAGGEQPVRWVFARDLLAEGLSRAVGDLDITVRPALDEHGAAAIHILLDSPDGRALLEGNADEVRAFITKTYEVVPAGRESEYVDVEGELLSLLGEA